MRKVRLCPSILNADQSNLDAEINRVAADSDLLHLDVMDGIFVPNTTFSFKESEQIIADSPLDVDVHLMICNPDDEAVNYSKAGAASVTFHLEASNDPHSTILRIKESGSRASIAVKPATPFSELEPFLAELDMVLIMTVEPGFGGQAFMPNMMEKVSQVRDGIDRLERDIWLQVDGGISIETIALAASSGADAFVAGSAVYKAESPAQMLRELRKLATATLSLE